MEWMESAFTRGPDDVGGLIAVSGVELIPDPSSHSWSVRDPGEEDGAAVVSAACATTVQLGDLIDFLSVDASGQSRICFIRPILKVGGRDGCRLVKAMRADPVFGKEATALLRLTPQNLT